MHEITIEKYKKKYIVRCFGDYSDIVKGKGTDYEFSEEFKTLGKARDYVKEFMEENVRCYMKHKKKVHIKFSENI